MLLVGVGKLPAVIQIQPRLLAQACTDTQCGQGVVAIQDRPPDVERDIAVYRKGRVERRLAIHAVVTIGEVGSARAGFGKAVLAVMALFQPGKRRHPVVVRQGVMPARFQRQPHVINAVFGLCHAGKARELDLACAGGEVAADAERGGEIIVVPLLAPR